MDDLGSVENEYAWKKLSSTLEKSKSQPVQSLKISEGA